MRLAIMAKAPIAGTVKTRLLPYLSAEEAAELARSLLLDQLSHLCAIEAADLYVAFTPPHEEALMRRLAPCFVPAFFPERGRSRRAHAEYFLSALCQRI